MVKAGDSGGKNDAEEEEEEITDELLEIGSSVDADDAGNNGALTPTAPEDPTDAETIPDDAQERRHEIDDALGDGAAEKEDKEDDYAEGDEDGEEEQRDGDDVVSLGDDPRRNSLEIAI